MKKTILQLFLLLWGFVTIPAPLIAQQRGHITYTLNKSANPTADEQDAYTRITAALDEAVAYYNSYTTITKHISANYVPDVATADASFNGTMRFGKNRSYMVVLTALHETAHIVGVGTTGEYSKLIVNGVFAGAKGTAMLREVTGDQGAVLKGDNMHFWPYGLNYASEFNSKDDYIYHAKIVNAMYQDMFKEEFYTACHVRSVSDGRYMTVAGGSKLVLGAKADSTSLVRLIALSDANTYRMEFSEKVLDISGESKQAGTAAGVWDWNGGGHQREVFEFDTKLTDKRIARIKMVHSGLYLRVNGDQIVQDNASAAIATQQWELADGGNTVAGSVDPRSQPLQLVVASTNNRLIILLPEGNGSLVSLYIADIGGKQLLHTTVKKRAVVNTPELAPGMYIASVRGSGVGVCKRFVVR